MTYLTLVLPDGSEVSFETAEEDVARGPRPVSRLDESRRSFEDAVDAVSRMAGSLVAKFRSALPEAPDELEIEFGLKASLEVNGFMVAKAGSEASYRVMLKWSKGEPSHEPGG